MKVAAGLLILALALSGCVSAADLVKALANDPASACVSIQIAFPPFANTAKACRTNRADQTATMDAAGNPSVIPIGTHTP